MTIRVNDLPELNEAPNNADELIIVDKSDTSISADGRVKKITYQNVLANAGGGDGISASATLNFEDINANSTKELEVQVDDISLGDWVVSSPITALPDGISIALTYANSLNNVVVRLANCTTSNITVGSADFIINKIVNSPVIAGVPVLPPVVPGFDWENDASLTLDLDSRTGVFTDAGASAAIDGNSIAQWDNQISNQDISNFQQATESVKPIYRTTGGQNGLPYLEFDDASNRRMISDQVSNYSVGTVIFVAEIEGSEASGQTGILGLNGQDGSLLGIRSGCYHSASSYFTNSSAELLGGVGRTRPVFTDIAKPVSINARWGSDKQWVIGENYAETGRSIDTSPSIDFGVNTELLLGDWSLGGVGGQARFTGKVYRVLMFNRYLTDSELTDVLDDLASLYGHHLTDQWFKDLGRGAQRGGNRFGYNDIVQFPTRELIVTAGQSNSITTNGDNPAQADSPTVTNVAAINSNYTGLISGVRKWADANSFENFDVPATISGDSLDPAEPAWSISAGILWNLNNANPNKYDFAIVAQGGSSLALEWDTTTGFLFESLVERIQNMHDTAGETDATIYTNTTISWLQGEADAGGSANAAAYQAREANLIDTLLAQTPQTTFNFVSATVFNFPFAADVNAGKTTNSARPDYTLVTGATNVSELHDGAHHTAQFAVDLSETFATAILAL